MRLDGELSAQGVIGELYIVGGAVMCLAFGARDSRRDEEALFMPVREVRQAAARVAAREGLADDWLNDAVKGFLGRHGKFDSFQELPNLRVFVAEPHYLLAMKIASMRLGEEYRDLEDVRYLLRHLDIRTTSEALEVVSRYFDDDRLPAKSRLALDELLG